VEGDAGAVLRKLRASGGGQPLTQGRFNCGCTHINDKGESSARVSHEQGIFVLAFWSRRVKCATVN
jgi:hypothetical protein